MRRAWAHVCKELSLNIPFENYRLHVGLPFEAIMQKLELQELSREIEQLYFGYTKTITQRYAHLMGRLSF